MNYFHPNEIYCRCPYNCGLGFDDLAHRVLVMANELRYEFGHPLKVSSSVRCPFHNIQVGGENFSYHLAVPGRLKGMAMDLTPLSGSVEELWKLADELFPNDQVGFYDWGVHIGASGKKMRFDKRSK